MDEGNIEEDDLLGEDLVDYGVSPEHIENLMLNMMLSGVGGNNPIKALTRSHNNIILVCSKTLRKSRCCHIELILACTSAFGSFSFPKGKRHVLSTICGTSMVEQFGIEARTVQPPDSSIIGVDCPR